METLVMAVIHWRQMTEGAPTDDQMTNWMKLLQPRGRAQAVGGVDDSAIG